MRIDVSPDHEDHDYTPSGRYDRRGRPSGLTNYVAGILLECIARGVTHKGATLRAGIDESTFYDWRNRGEAEIAAGTPDTPHAAFAKSLKMAEGQGIYESMLQIHTGMDRWQSSAWHLERRYPDEYGLKKDQSPITIFQYGGEPPKDDGTIPPELLADDPA